MGVCPPPARHVARPTLCVSGLCHRLPRAGLGATQTTTDPVRDRRVKFPYPHSLGTLVGVTSRPRGEGGGSVLPLPALHWHNAGTSALLRVQSTAPVQRTSRGTTDK